MKRNIWDFILKYKKSETLKDIAQNWLNSLRTRITFGFSNVIRSFINFYIANGWKSGMKQQILPVLLFLILLQTDENFKDL